MCACDTYEIFVIKNVGYSNIFDVNNPSLVSNYKEKRSSFMEFICEVIEDPVVKDQRFLLISNALFECQYAA